MRINMTVDVMCGLLAFVMTSCTGAKLEGTWVEPVPGNDAMVQGFTLKHGGMAESVNMATLLYDSWRLVGDTLILTGQSIGNHQALAFADTLVVVSLTRDSLILCRDRDLFRYGRSNVHVDGQVVSNVDETVTVKGVLTIGHEVRSFVASGDTTEYWVVDHSGRLERMYDDLTGGMKNGIPVYVEMTVLDRGKSDEGFAESYDGLYEVKDIIDMHVLE